MTPRKRKQQTIDTSKDTLVIVESPAKAKTIKKYLGPGFEVAASMGHIVDLAKGNDAIDKKKDFQPTYQVASGKRTVVSALKKAAKTMNAIWLATDEDREGEAIARHLCNELGLDVDKTPRIVFHEITKSAIQNAASNPRSVDMNLVNAQQARRILDRLVGFELSPVLRKKIKTGLSAGRVQSVAVRLLVEREREIQDFTAQYAFKVSGMFTNKDGQGFDAVLKNTIDTKKATETLLQSYPDATFVVDSVEQKPRKRSPRPPFTTSSLQQAASSKLGYSVGKTMQLAQRLYEAGHITYMRTDSIRLSGQAIGNAKKTILQDFGDKYLQTRQYKNKKGSAQEAHEAIRPTSFAKKSAGTSQQQKKLYQLIWQRAIASQMSPAQVLKTTVTIGVSSHDDPFIAKGEVITFDGFLAAYGSKKPAQGILPPIKEGEKLTYDTITAAQVYKKPPARYTEASLVKKLETLGIGRPSTYAPTISTIQQRNYVKKGISSGKATQHAIATLKNDTLKRSTETKNLGSTQGKLVPTSVGMVVTDFLKKHFPDIMDYSFTASVEEQFDTIAQGELQRQEMLKKFYNPFHKTVETVTEDADRAVGERILGKHPESGKTVLVRIGRYGPLVQLGEQGDEDVEYGTLPSVYNIETVTLEEALEAFALPRVLGEWNDKPIKASIGRFGPYVQRGSTFASIKQPENPYDIDYDTALELIEEKIQKDKERLLQTFTYNDKEGIVQKGRRSHQIKRNRKIIRLPKTIDGAELSQKEIEAYIEEATKTKKKKKSKKTTKKKATKKKTTKKKTTKKTTKKAPTKKKTTKKPTTKKSTTKKKTSAKKTKTTKKPTS